MYLNKLIILLFLLIFINISNGEKCKCSKNKKKIFQIRHKRASDCSCSDEEEVRGNNSNNEEFRRREGKKQIIGDEEEEEKDFEEFSEIIKLKKVLIICNNFYYSPFKFYKLIAKILSKKYQVDMLVYTKKEENYLKISNNLQIIYIPINKDFIEEESDDNYNEFIKSFECFFIGIYKEIFTNEQVFIGNNKYGILEYLLVQNYSFGITDINEMISPLAIFEALNIKNVFNITSSVFFPKYLQFLKDNEGNSINVNKLQIPEFSSVLPGDWEEGAEIWEKGSERYNENQQEIEMINNQTIELLEENYKYYYIKLFNEENIYINKMPSNFIKLFKKIKYYFVNQNIHGIFKPFPLHKKIVYIGGIHIEENNKINIYKKIFDEHEFSCVVLVTFGTVKISGGLNINHIEMMFNEFIKYNYCKFKIRIDTKLLKKEYPPNLEITNTKLKQQKILFEKNTKLFISHCGQHSLTEAIYGGIPLICIPYGGDQFYNSSIVEHLNIGIYLNLEIMNEFPKALKNLMKKK